MSRNLPQRAYGFFSPIPTAQRAKCQGRWQFHREWQCRGTRFRAPTLKQPVPLLQRVTQDRSASALSAYGQRLFFCPNCSCLSSANSLQQFACDTPLQKKRHDVRDKSPQRAWKTTVSIRLFIQDLLRGEFAVSITIIKHSIRLLFFNISASRGLFRVTDITIIIPRSLFVNKLMVDFGSRPLLISIIFLTR